MKDFEILKQLEHEAKEKGSIRNKVKVAKHKVRLGFATAGLRDILLATELLPEGERDRTEGFDAALEGALGGRDFRGLDQAPVLTNFAEALRVYARDVQLSRAQDRLLPKTIERSVDYFGKALELLKPEQQESRAWVLAHRAAARMMQYWLGLAASPSAGGDDNIFVACEQGFVEACTLFEKAKKKPYIWAVQFRAFLYALRGRGNDFDVALGLLTGLPAEVLARPTIQRSIAMLASYNAAPHPPESRTREQREAAAGASIAAAMDAQRADQDEFLASYSGAVSSWALLDMLPPPPGKNAQGEQQPDPHADERLQRLRNAETAVETADIRARNAVSQALVALTGLTFVRAKLAIARGANPRGPEVAALSEESGVLQDLIEGSEFRDIESRAMVIRDPVWQAILRDGDCRDQFARPGFDQLRTFSRSENAVKKAKSRYQAL